MNIKTWRKQLFINELNIVCFEDIIYRNQQQINEEKIRNYYIEKSEKKIIEKYQNDMKFITKIETH